MPVTLQRWWPLVLLGLGAFWLRTYDLARRPMHADEANQAVKTGELLEAGRYAFDPRDHHGPTLYYATLPIAWLRGQTTLAALDETTVRLVPALAGTLAVLLLAALAAPLGRWPALAAAAWFATSPPVVYYSRHFGQEMLLVTFTLATLVAAQRWWLTGRVSWAVAAGVCAGLMQATKESAPLFVLAGAVALVVVRPPSPASTRIVRDLLWAGVAALVVAAAFYSSFGTHVAGLRDAVAAYGQAFTRATGETGHEKPWWYYPRLLAWQRRGGVVFEQVALSAFALAGAGLALGSGNKFLRGAAVYTLVVAVALSLIPYKTPWHVVHVIPGLALLAAGALAAPPNWRVAAGLALGALALQFAQMNRVAFTYAGDARNPYAYVHSSPDVLKFRARAVAALSGATDRTVRVIGEEYWPLPWYLRGLPGVGYWSAPPADCDGALVIVTASQAEAVRARLHGTYEESFLGLRPGVVCVLFTPSP